MRLSIMNLASRYPRGLFWPTSRSCRSRLVFAAASGPKVRHIPTRYSAKVPAKASVAEARQVLQKKLKEQDLEIPETNLQLISQDGDEFYFGFQRPENNEEDSPESKSYRKLKSQLEEQGCRLEEQRKDIAGLRKRLDNQQGAIDSDHEPILVRALKDQMRLDTLLALGFPQGKKMRNAVMQWQQTLAKLNKNQRKVFMESTTEATRAFLALSSESQAILDASRAAHLVNKSGSEDYQSQLAHAVSTSKLTDLERRGAEESFEAIDKGVSYQSRLQAAILLRSL